MKEIAWSADTKQLSSLEVEGSFVLAGQWGWHINHIKLSRNSRVLTIMVKLTVYNRSRYMSDHLTKMFSKD